MDFDKLIQEPALLLAAGIALLAFVLMRRALRVQRRARTAIEPAPGAVERKRASSALTDAPVELVRWQVEMHDTARDLKAELDSKISALQTLLVMAQHERKQLEALLDRAEHSGARSAPRRAAEPTSSSHSNQRDLMLPGDERQRAEVYALSEEGRTPREISAALDLPIGEVEFLLALRLRT